MQIPYRTNVIVNALKVFKREPTCIIIITVVIIARIQIPSRVVQMIVRNLIAASLAKVRTNKWEGANEKKRVSSMQMKTPQKDLCILDGNKFTISMVLSTFQALGRQCDIHWMYVFWNMLNLLFQSTHINIEYIRRWKEKW